MYSFPSPGFEPRPHITDTTPLVLHDYSRPYLVRDPAIAHANADDSPGYRYAHLADLPDELQSALRAYQPGGPINSLQHCGYVDGEHLIAVGLSAGDESLPHFEARELRRWFPDLSPELMAGIARASQVIYWDSTTRFCPRCGSATAQDEAERVKRCRECGLDQYPRITPAVIVAVRRGDRLLLARNAKRTQFFSVLAGFIEVGESAEECVHREVQEEVGIRVKNVRYFDSQHWPFPSTLMLGYTAEWESGEIEGDGVEIAEADWFSADDLPPVPGKMSISRRLIDSFFANHGQ